MPTGSDHQLVASTAAPAPRALVPSIPRQGDDLATDLGAALDDGALHLHYQPIYDLTTGRLIHHEALARWRHPMRGDISPSTFVPVAERCGLIGQLGRWALTTAVQQAADWSASSAPASVAVNVSPHQFTAGTVVDDVATALGSAGLPPGQLVVELTESALITDLAAMVAQLHELREMGLRLALDDFGTGFSSLTLIRQLPVHTVKIDRSFVDRLDVDPADAALIHLVIEAAHTLGLRTCAEGVERPEQLLKLSALGCDSVQGYLLGRPAAPQPHPMAAHPLLPVGSQAESAAEYDSVLPALGQLVCILAPDLTISYVSASCTTMLGYRPAELIGHEVQSLLHPDDRATLGPDAVSEGKRTAVRRTLRTRVRHQDGSYRWLRFESRLVDGDRTGARTHLMCTAQDVTSGVEARRELQRSQRLFQTAFELAPGPMAVADTSGRWLQVNRAWAELLGSCPDRLQGLNFRDMTHPDDMAESVDRFHALLLSGNHYTLIKRLRHHSGSWVWVTATIALIRDAAGLPDTMVVQLQAYEPRAGSGGQQLGLQQSGCGQLPAAGAFVPARRRRDIPVIAADGDGDITLVSPPPMAGIKSHDG